MEYYIPSWLLYFTFITRTVILLPSQTFLLVSVGRIHFSGVCGKHLATGGWRGPKSPTVATPVPCLSCSTYGELTNCTVAVAENLTCYWPNRLVDEFFVAVHSHYFRNCSPSGRALRDPPNGILCPFILVPILVTLLVTALVVWRSKRSEGIV